METHTELGLYFGKENKFWDDCWPFQLRVMKPGMGDFPL